MTQAGPRGWIAGTVLHREQRFADAAATPLTYDDATGCVDAVLSKGSPVRRFYGSEVLKIDRSAVIVGRLAGGGIPLLNSHAQGDITAALGRVTRVWFSDGALMGRLQFNQTRMGQIAQGMVRRREITAISVGYRVEQWEITDEGGNVVDPEEVQWSWDVSDRLTYTATHWELLEASLVCIPADADAMIRSLDDRHADSADARFQMECRQRMYARQAMHDAQQATFDES